METMGERLKRALKLREMTPPQLIAATGLSKGTVYNILDDTTKVDKVRAHTLDRISNRLQVHSAWLRNGRLPMQLESGEAEDLVTVRLWDARAAAGGGADNSSSELTGGLIFRGRSLRNKGLQHEKCDTFYVAGDSMLPRLRPGDAILFDQTDTKIRDGKMYVIDWGGDTRVKRLYRELDGSIRVTSDNKADPENVDRIVGPYHDGFSVIGRVRWVGSWED